MSEEVTLTDVLNHEADVREMLYRRTALLRSCMNLLESNMATLRDKYDGNIDHFVKEIRAELGEG